MFQETNPSKILRATIIVTVAFFALLINFSYIPAAHAGDNYSAPTDTYQETRNPNRVNTTKEELAKSNLDRPEENKGESIYERVVDKVNQQAGKDSEKTTKK